MKIYRRLLHVRPYVWPHFTIPDEAGTHEERLGRKSEHNRLYTLQPLGERESAKEKTIP